MQFLQSVKELLPLDTRAKVLLYELASYINRSHKDWSIQYKLCASGSLYVRVLTKNDGVSMRISSHDPAPDSSFEDLYFQYSKEHDQDLFTLAKEILSKIYERFNVAYNLPKTSSMSKLFYITIKGKECGNGIGAGRNKYGNLSEGLLRYLANNSY